MSAAACKIIICGAKLLQACGDTMIRTDESAADVIIQMLEQLTEDVRNL